MATILIVHAHPEPQSFSSALARTAAETFTAAGHEVLFSDLYAMSFDPVSNRGSFTTVADAAYFKPQAEELHATAHAGFVPALDAEMRKLEACDLLVFSCPLWWFGLPAILKGWIDRVFAFGRIYGQGRWYERGLGAGRRAMVLLTTGSPATAFRRGGLHASIESILTPVHHGVFWFNGFSPLGPFVAWGAAHITAEERAAALVALRRRLATVWTEPVPAMPQAADHEPGSWTDRRPRFLVTARAHVAPAIHAGELPSTRDLEILRELRRSGQLVRAMIGRPDDGAWHAAFEMRTPEATSAVALLEGLPMARLGELTCVPLDPGLEDALSPYWVS